MYAPSLPRRRRRRILHRLARTAEQDDYTRLADLQDFVDVPEEGAYLDADVPRRCNCDKAPIAGTWGDELLELCRSTELLIVNGRTPGDPTGGYTFTSPQGQSVVDYFLVSAQHLSSVTDMRVMRDAQYCNLSRDMPQDSEKSDHFPLQLDLSCDISIPSAGARSTSSQSSTRPQFKYVDLQAEAYQQCLTAELLMHLVPLLTGAIDVDAVLPSWLYAWCKLRSRLCLKSASALDTTLFQGILGLTQNVKLPKK